MASPTTETVRPAGVVKALPFPKSIYTKAIDEARRRIGGKIITGVKLPGYVPASIHRRCKNCSLMIPCHKHIPHYLDYHDRRKPIRQGTKENDGTDTSVLRGA